MIGFIFDFKYFMIDLKYYMIDF